MLVRRWILVTSLLAVACGGRAVIDEGDATTTGSGSGGVSGGFGGQAAAGGSPTGGSSTGGSSGGGAGEVGGGAGDGGGPVGECPPEKPTQGSCSVDGLVCDYGGFCNFVICEGGAWQQPLC